MKKLNWYRNLSLADDKYIDEAHPDHVIKPKRNRVFLSLVAACACVALIVCSAWLFIPFNTTSPDESHYADSEYYTLIQKLKEFTSEQPTYKNYADKLLAWLNNQFSSAGKGEEVAMPDVPEMNDGEVQETLPGDMATNGTGAYQEITDNQVEGIIEADRIKRSDTHIYYLDNEVLRIFSIDKENTKEVGSYTLYEGSRNYYLDQWEFYLSNDAKTVTVVTQCYEKKESYSNRRSVNLISLDVSDPANIVKKEEFNITGSYMSSRKTDGSILLLTEFVIDKNELDFDDETTFIPQIDTGNGTHSIPASGIIVPDTLSNIRYTVVTKLEENTLALKGTAAYLSYSEDVYVSPHHVFLTRVFADQQDNKDGTITRNSMTEISCLTYDGDSFERKGTVTVRGYVKDQWSMDEYEDILRVFTTTNATTIMKQYDNGTVSAEILQTATGQSNASLYCIDLSTFEIVASVIDFAPPREEIQSVRFDKETAYVCTSIEMSDPVFFFDLSDLANITYKDTGTIDGFSTSLINLGNGYLLGIGRGGNWSSFKVEVYEETKDGVRSVCSYELEDAHYSTEYKSYYVDRKNQLVGIGVIDYSYYHANKHSDEAGRYILLHFDGYALVELVNVPLSGDPANMRGVYIDGYMYMFGKGDFQVEKVFD